MIAHRILEAYKGKLVSFQKYSLKLKKQHQYLLGQTGNADQTSDFFDMMGFTTLTSAGEQTVHLELWEPRNNAALS